jgi:hypothetical protein
MVGGVPVDYAPAKAGAKKAAPPKQVVCRHGAGCRNKKTCTFSHTAAAAAGPAAAAAAAPDLADPDAFPAPKPKGKGAGAAPSKKPAAAATTTDTPKPKGKKDAQSSGAGAAAAAAPNDKKGTKPCKFFQQGGCKNGDACNFSHDVVAPAADGAPGPADAQ